MRVLYLDHVEADYLSAIVFRGLCEELGPENVVDWPWQPHFHGQNYDGPVPYGTDARGTVTPFPWMTTSPAAAWSDEEVIARLAEFDLVILASPRAYNTARLRELIGRVGREAIRKLAMLDGEDYTSVRWDFALEFKPSTYFKTSLVEKPLDLYPAQRARVGNRTRVLPCPLTTTFGEVPAVEKTVDVSFLGGSFWHGERREGVTEDRGLLKPVLEAAIREVLPEANFVSGNVDYREFQKTLAASRIAVCVGGHGLEPMRTYETMSCPGTLAVRGEIPQLTPWPLVDGVNCATYTQWQDIPRVCARWLADEEARQGVATQGNKLVRDHYTPSARARYILEEALR